ncbi:helix-turn-helix domain-containing protein [Eubacterium multiforme]|uniref:Transcriptional regulator with XRE-family HTH domain n=1 Tax=Eubacterium multiforme TaxID=83339 RepID=A0ABT9UR90_9FIRM|nr:helix-turn-helix domain-containing protein [Eubacterium multiforme]MDQ0148588.1 transcriptional regulator with XRE-family HTH domain [Eubacterium multiforme]
MKILSLGEKIKRKRKELNMTLKDLAKDRITPGQISLVESGRSNPSMDLLEYLAENLNTTVEYLMESEESQAEKMCTYYEQIAEAHILDEGYTIAEKYIEDALNYAEEYNLENKKAKILYLRGKINVGEGKLILAEQCFLSANIIFIKNNNFEDIIKTFLNLAKITLKLKSYYSANSHLKQAEKVFMDNDICNDYLLGEIYFYLSKTYFEMDNLSKSTEYASLANEQFEKIHNKEEYAKNLLLLSEEHNKNGNLEKAITYSKKSLKLYKEMESLDNIYTIENELGKLFYNFENIDESFKHYEFAKDIKIQNNDGKLIKTLINICGNYLKIKDLDKCQKVLDEISEKITEEDVEERIECSLIKYTMYIINERKIEAESILIDSYRYAKEKNMLQKAGEISIMLGKFYIDNKNSEQANKYLNEGVSIFKKTGILNN